MSWLSILLIILIIVLVILCVSYWRRQRLGGLEDIVGEVPQEGILATGAGKDDDEISEDKCLLEHFETIRRRMLLDGESVEDKVIVEMFYTEWCPHCKDMKKPWEEAQEKMEDDSDYVFLEQNQDYSNSPGVPYIPYVVKHKPGDKQVHHYVGKKETKPLVSWIKS